MTESKRGPMPSQDSPEHITVFEVDAYGTLRIANFTEPVTREDFYDELITGWSRSPKDLAAALEVCRPLVSEVYSICAETANSAQVEHFYKIVGGEERRCERHNRHLAK